MRGRGLQPGHSGAGYGPAAMGGNRQPSLGMGGLGLKALSFQLATSMDLAWWMQTPWSWRPRNGWRCPRSTPVLPSLTRGPGELSSCTFTGPCWRMFGGWGDGGRCSHVHSCACRWGHMCARQCVCVCVCVLVCMLGCIHVCACMCTHLWCVCICVCLFSCGL